MGLLVEGVALSPEEMKEHLNYIREHGISQFLATWNRYYGWLQYYSRVNRFIFHLLMWRVKDIQDDELRFGDEIECGIFFVDKVRRTIQISIKSAEVLIILRHTSFIFWTSCIIQLRGKLIEKELLHAHESEGCTWHPEFGAWMIESTPSKPYTNYVSDLLRVERNMVTLDINIIVCWFTQRQIDWHQFLLADSSPTPIAVYVGREWNRSNGYNSIFISSAEYMLIIHTVLHICNQTNK